MAFRRSQIRQSRPVAFLLTDGSNVNPGLINPWLINRGVSPFSGDSSLLGRVY